MDTMSFFKTVVPSDGFKYLIEIAKNGSMRHTAYPDYDSMHDAAELMIEQRKPFYFACASYKELEYNEHGYVIGRKQSNVKWVKSLWQDFDVGKFESDGITLKSISYATKADAVAAIKDLMVKTGLPRPLLVSSGNGFHAYWPFTEAVSPAQWNELAALVRSVYMAVGIKFDSSRDLDSASILRPVGSFNGDNEVAVVREQEPKPYAYYYELFSRYAAANALTITQPKATKEKLVNEFSGTKEFPPSSLVAVAEKCNQVRLFRETGCDEEPIWHKNLGVAKHCTDGEPLAHEWSKQYPGYTAEETQEKLDNWKYGPTTCEAFSKVNPAGCEGCAFAGKVTSPIQLGYDDEPDAPEVEVPEINPNTPNPTAAIPHWPKGFRVSASGVIEYMHKDDAGLVTSHRVASPLFYPVERIRLDDGTYAYTMRMEFRPGQWRTFEIPAKLFADTKGLKTALASYEVIVFNDKLLATYTQAHADTMRRYVDEINTFKQFGWTKDKDAFLIGSSLISASGRTEVRVSDEFIRDPRLLEAGIVRGSKEEWSRGVEKLYNRPNGEIYRYTVCTQFGAPLVSLLNFDEWNGIPLALTSGDSGFGKSTVCKIGINALSDSRKTTISDSTAKAIIGRASVMNNLPLLIDEVTASLKDPKELSDVLYSLSNGRMRIGMQSDGKERVPSPPFKLNATLNGNKNLMVELTESKTNPEATQMRVFEVAMEDYPRMDSLLEESSVHGEHAEIALRLVDHCHGVWADEYFSYLFANRKEIEERLHKTAIAIIKSLGGGAAKERFYAYHMACTLVGGLIAKRIGAIQFDLTELKNWGFEHILKMRGIANQFSENVEEKFSNLLADLHGTILVTKHFDLLDTRAGNTEMPMLPMRQGLNARLVLGSDKERGKLFITVRAVEEWCSKKGIAAPTFKRQLAAASMLRGGGDQGKGFDKKVSVGKGVPSMPTGRSRCYEFDYAIAQGYVEEHLASNVVPITALAAAPQPPATDAPVSSAPPEL